jgi:hypothetical protein
VAFAFACVGETVDVATAATTTLRAGAITLTLTHGPLDRATLPAPPLGGRVPGFLLASLVVHLAIWFVAMQTAPPAPPVVERVPPRLVHIAAVARIPAAVLEAPPILPPPLKAAPAPPPRPARPRPAPGKRTTGVQLASRFEVDAAAISRHFEAATVTSSSGESGPRPPGFGEGRGFDPAYGSEPSGPYQIATYRVRQCARTDPRCQLDGPTTVKFVRTYMLDRMAEIYDCHAHHGGDSTVVIAFTIRGDGSVTRASGDGEAATCIARIVETITFRAQWPRDDSDAYDTRVRWPITFR